ncbi:MAG: D-Ala-D-Ala carboxypeptidase family metallohydrolase [Bacteroidota bacterium]
MKLGLRMNRKQGYLIFTICLAAAAVIAWQFPEVRYCYYQIRYDLSHKNESVEDEETVEAILNDLETISYSELPTTFLQISGSDQSPFDRHLANASYYLVPVQRLPKRIVGQFRIRQLVSRDQWYRRALLGKESTVPLLLDRRILFKLLALRKELLARGLDPDAFRLNHGHRNPQHNQTVGGASRSRHIFGEALDLQIEDINQDGKVNRTDKQLVLTLLDQKLLEARVALVFIPVL